MFFVILPQASLSRMILNMLKLVLLVLSFPINRSRFKSRERTRDAKFIVLFRNKCLILFVAIYMAGYLIMLSPNGPFASNSFFSVNLSPK